MNSNKIQVTVVDAGARYGIHPSWEPVKKLVNFKMFEVDPKECKRLKIKYEKFNNIDIFNLALASKKGELEFIFREHKGLTSVYETSDEIKKNNYKSMEFQEINKFKTKSDKLDDIFSNDDIDFLKLDVEGAELDVLNGSNNLLNSSILGVRSEVCFSPVFKNAPLFGDIDNKLRDFKFQLINLDYDGKGAAKNEFTLNDKYGNLISSDGVWIKPLSVLLNGSEVNAALSIIKTSLFLTLNHATDIAVDFLSEANRRKINLIQFSEDPVYLELKKRLAILFKSLLDKPQYKTSQIVNKWNEIYQEEFPLLSNFWESNYSDN